jgi:hypothetical protein
VVQVVGPNAPAPVTTVQATAPDGLEPATGAVSATSAVHVVAVPGRTGLGAHVTLVALVRFVVVIVAVLFAGGLMPSLALSVAVNVPAMEQVIVGAMTVVLEYWQLGELALQATVTEAWFSASTALAPVMAIGDPARPA